VLERKQGSPVGGLAVIQAQVEGVAVPFASPRTLWRMKQTVRAKEKRTLWPAEAINDQQEEQNLMTWFNGEAAAQNVKTTNCAKAEQTGQAWCDHLAGRKGIYGTLFLFALFACRAVARAAFRCNRLAAFALFTLALAVGAIAGVPPAEINPALRYYQALLLVPKFEPEDSHYLFETDWRGRRLDERFGRLTSKYDGSFNLLRKAAQTQVPCDWGVDLNDGPPMLMPRLAPAKHLVQVARMRIHWQLQNDQQTEARDDLLAALALGRNLSRDGVGVSALVQFSIEELIAWAVAENFFQFSPETLRQIAEGLDAAPARGTVAQSIPIMEYLFCDWYLKRIDQFRRENPGDEAKVLDLIRDLFRPTLVSEEEKKSDLPNRLIAAGGGTSAGVADLIRALEPHYRKLERIMALPYAEYGPSFETFKAEIGRLSNPLAQRFLGYDRSRRNEFGTQVQLAMVRAAIAYKLHGEQGLKAVMDPCGDGAFTMQRFIFDGVDRGFKLRSKLKSGYSWNKDRNEVLIFVEKDGKPFSVSGPNAGAPLLDQAETMRLRYGLPRPPAGTK
jgi:hypothetical protein